VPLYEYECSKCHQITEALQKFSDAPLKKCPHCSGKLRKLMSLNSFHLKGSGWYVTDYAGKKAGSQPEAKSSGEKTAEKEQSSKTEKSDASTPTSSN
jgi:putative FmdB family regulatory protein